jgi:serine phosphatase RsbU (regulator of sigma subunit)
MMAEEEKLKLIEKLERKLMDKEAELNELYDILGRLNSYIKNIIDDTEAGVRAAMALHRKFSSRKFPNVPGITFASRYVVSTSDSSSYYELFELPENMGIGLVMSDSSGYGISSLIMSVIVSLLDTPLVKSPKAFFDTLIKDLSSSLKTDTKAVRENQRSAHMCILTIQRGELALRYISVGMPGILVIRDNERIQLDVDQGNTLKGFEIKERDFKLAPGDRIVVPNNGLIKSVNAGGEVFGMNRMVHATGNAQHISIGDIITNIGFELDSFIEGKRARLYGDLTAVGIELERRMLYVV